MSSRAKVIMTLAYMGLFWATGAMAQLPIPPSTQFDLTGFLQEATLDSSCVANAHCGGTLKVNGQVVTVPKETIVILPANALTWQELFAQAPLPYGLSTSPPTTGLAAADDLVSAPPLTTYEVHVTGNRVLGPPDQYIAGLINISQNALNSGAGFINFIDYTNGELRVGGVLNSSSTGTRVRLNDPTGRYGRIMSPDARFTVDADNPTIMAGTGFPMCLPRVAPANGDAACPAGNRPPAAPPATGFAASINMPDPALVQPGALPDPRIQAPFEVGDYVTFAGTLVVDAGINSGPTTGPWPGIANTYISAHTIVNNVAIFTAPGTDPAYVMTEVTLIGTGGLTVLGAGEAAIRTRFEGMTTDTSRNIHLYGIDLDPITGVSTDRDWGTIGVDQGPPTGAVKGRWRFRPPCTAAVATDKACTPPPGGTFLPPTREMRAVIEGLQSQNPANAGAQTAANGIFYGQYHAPISEYIFPENIPGSPIVENNFNSIAFLACGGYASSAGTLAGSLLPWPSNIVPTCGGAQPVANAGAAQTAPSGSTVTLNGNGSTGANLTFLWTQTGGPGVTLNPNRTTAVVTFTAPTVAASTTLTFSLTVSNAAGSSTATTTVTVSPGAPPPDTVTITLVEYRISKQRLTVTATSSNPNAVLTLQPYISTGGVTVPGGQLTLQAGVLTIIEVGVPQPAAGNSITVTSNLGGSARSGITRLRQ
jgi:hypothetical protein